MRFGPIPLILSNQETTMPRLAVLVLILALVFQGCATYEPKVQPYKLPEASANMQRVAGAYVAARAWDKEEEAQRAFGFNIIRAGLLPVQVSFDNRGNQTLVIVPSQTFLINQRQEIFPVLSDTEAYERVRRGTQLQETVKGVTQGGLLGTATGALLGAAVGVVAGHGAGEFALRGLTMGGATGAVLGGAQGAGSIQVPVSITQDLTRRNLQNIPIKPGELAYGLILFPREAGRPQALRLQLQDQDSGQVYTLTLNL
jgi:outer membrane lipoprotein SlyB